MLELPRGRTFLRLEFGNQVIQLAGFLVFVCGLVLVDMQVFSFVDQLLLCSKVFLSVREELFVFSFDI